MEIAEQERERLLRARAVSFCQSFVRGRSPWEILEDHFIPDTNGIQDSRCRPKITEHGPRWAISRLPFLSRTFIGRDFKPNDDDASRKDQPETGETCDAYFRLLTATLEFKPDEDVFPRPEGFAVDIHADDKTPDQISGSVLGSNPSTGPGSSSSDSESTSAAAGADTGRAGGNRGGVVTVVGHASFSSKKTGRTWKEQFIHRLSAFDELGRIGHWQIWADPLSAWMAVGGENEEAVSSQDRASF